MNRLQQIDDPLDRGWLDEPPSFRSFMGMVRRQAAVVMLCIMASIVISLIFIIYEEPLYTARVSLYLDAEGNADAPRSEVATAIDLDTVVELIRSDHTTAAVIRALDLEREPEFAPGGSALGAAVNRLRELLGLVAADTETADPMLAVILKVRSGLKVARNGNTRVLDLQYTSRSPDLAVAIVNAFAREHIDSMTSRDEGAVASRITRLNLRVEDMRQNAAAASARIRTILHDSGLFTADPQELEGRIAALREKLSEHEAKVAALSAKLAVYSNYEQSGDDTTIDTPEGRRLITELGEARQRLLDVRQKSDVSPNLVSATESGIKNLEASLRQEIRFAERATEVERAVTIAEHDNFADQIQLLGDYVASDAWAELEAVRQKKIFYDGMYQDYLTQLEGAGRERRNRPDLRIVADALRPTIPSSPDIKLWLAIAVSFAILIGLCIASLREWNRHERSQS